MPTWTEGWYVDGEPVAAHGRVLETREGWDDLPALRGDDVEMLGRHGERFRPKLYGPGRKTLTIGVHGTGDDGWSLVDDPRQQRAAYEEHLDALLRMFAARRRLLDVVRVHADGSRRRAGCQVVTALAPKPLGHSYGQVVVELAIPSAFWEDVDPTSYALPYDVARGGPQTLEVHSLIGQTAPCPDARVEVTGPCTAVSMRDEETGRGWSYTGAVSTGQVLEVDAGAWTARLDGTSVITALAYDTAQLLEVSLAPSASRGPRVLVDIAGGGAGTRITIQTRRRWLR